ncbi:MAG: polysaccharide lyase 6 family protein [Paludibacter sp.]
MKFKPLSIILFTLISMSIFAKSTKVQNIEQYKECVKAVVAGDTIILSNGVWKDAQLVFKGLGESGKYICLMAETPGKVRLEGKSCLTLSGNWLYVSGLVFVNGSSPKKTVIEFKTSAKDYAYNSVLTNCVIDKFNQPIKDSADHWIGLWGKKNNIENCYFGGKSNIGTTLVVWPNDSNSINNGHHIYRNYFGPRPRLGSNGGESIRIGTSTVCTMTSKTIVEGNYFEHCNGEVEIISNKSGDNSLINNTFWECEGSIVLRHGNNALVSGNWFIGNGKEFTGGVRVINEGHKIFNNFFYKLRGDGFRSALTIMNGIPNSPASGYAPVKNVIIANNTYYDCATPWAFCVGVEERNRIMRPEDVLILNNLVYCPKSTDLIKSFDKTDGIKLNNNLMISDKGALKDSGTVAGEVLIGKVVDFEVPFSSLKAKKLPFVKYDILGQIRSESVIGAFQNKGEKPAIEMATSMNCGPEWYKSTSTTVKKKIAEAKIIRVKAGTDLLYNAIKKANDGDIIELLAGNHIVSKKLTIAKSISIRGAEGSIKPTIKIKSDRANGTIFEITGNASLHIDGVAINGDSKAEFPAKYAITAAKEVAQGYSLLINNCEIYDFKVETGAIFKAYKGSLADSIKVTNSILRNSYRGFCLGEEKEDIGKYSAEDILFENTVFNNFSQYIIDYYRGGNDESTLGGAFKVNHCVFDNIAQDEKQNIFKLTGIVNVSINNSIFNHSLAKTTFKLYGAKNSISNCCINDCSDPKLENGAKSLNTLNVNPGFEKNSYKLSKKSLLKAKASDGKDIGLPD